MTGWERRGQPFRVCVRAAPRRNPVRVPTRPGGMTWCSGTVEADHGGETALGRGTLCDVLVDTDTVDNRACGGGGGDCCSSGDGRNSARLYQFTCMRTTIPATRPGATVVWASHFHGDCVAPPDALDFLDEFGADGDETAAHAADVVGKEQRASVFASWLVATFGAAQLCRGAGVLDVAAGRGNLSAELLRLVNRCDQRSDGIALRCTLVEPSQRDTTPDILQTRVATVLEEEFHNPAFAVRHPDLVKTASVFVGLHPDQPTEAIVDMALALGKPFAVVPCCVFPTLFPERRLATGQRVNGYGGFLRYLRAKHPRIEVARLGFEGRNAVLFLRK